MRSKTRVAVFSNEEKLSSSFQNILTKSDQFNYIGMFSDKNELLYNIQKNLIDVLLIDGKLLVADSIIVKKIRSLNEKIKLIGIIENERDIGIEKLLLEEVHGYVSLSQNLDVIFRAITICSLGGIFLSEDIKKNIFKAMSEKYSSIFELSLSPREKQIASLYCEGLTYKEIATRLFISPETVKTHLKNISCKFRGTYFDRTNFKKRHKLSKIRRIKNNNK